MSTLKKPLAAAIAMALALSPIAPAQNSLSQGPSTGSTPYLLPVLPGIDTISVLTVDNTGSIADDVVPHLSIPMTSYGMAGIPDGTGAFDNGDGTFTFLANHEIASGGAVREHGSNGAYVSKWIIHKHTLAVVGGEDLIKRVFLWDATAQASSPTASTTAFARFCSADLPEVSAFYNAATGLGTQERIYTNGEEGGAGREVATVVTGPTAGNAYVLGKFNLSTNGSGIPDSGAWENSLANPFPQDKTIVIGNNDGGNEIMNNSIAVYVGNKQNFGSEVDKAGLNNGTLKFVVVAGNPVEVVNSSTRATNITNGTRFSLSGTSSTAFSRPEDGAWNPSNPREFYFVTTDVLDTVSDGLGGATGQTRLWRLTFDDITNPDSGGFIDLLIDGRTVNGQKVNMFDNITVNKKSGHIILQEDVGGAAHNGKIWEFDPTTFTGATNTGDLTMIAKHDPARFGDRAGGVTTPATPPYNNDEESSGIIDISDIMSDSAKNKGNPREAWYISSDQAHYTSGITPAQVEGGQFFVLHQIAPENNLQVTRSGIVRDRRSGVFVQQITFTNNTPGTLSGPFYFILDGLSETAGLVGQSGTTSFYAPLASPYIGFGPSSLAPGDSTTIVLQFANPTNAAISYTDRVLNSVSVP
jgi:hypothetical protein